MAELEKVALDQAARSRDEFWSQLVVGEANGSLFKVAKGIKETVWHAHEDQDEVFVVTSGELTVQLRSGDITLKAGEMLVIPRGVEHCPKADDVVHFLIIGREITSNAAGGKPAWSYGDAPPSQYEDPSGWKVPSSFVAELADGSKVDVATGVAP